MQQLTSKEFTAFLARLEEGTLPVAVNENGVPVALEGGGIYEILAYCRSITKAYNIAAGSNLVRNTLVREIQRTAKGGIDT